MALVNDHTNQLSPIVLVLDFCCNLPITIFNLFTSRQWNKRN